MVFGNLLWSPRRIAISQCHFFLPRVLSSHLDFSVIRRRSGGNRLWHRSSSRRPNLARAFLGPDPTKGFRPDLYPSKPRWDHSGYFGYVPIPRKIICQTKVLVVICCHVFTSLSPVRKQQECEWGVCVCVQPAQKWAHLKIWPDWYNRQLSWDTHAGD